MIADQHVISSDIQKVVIVSPIGMLCARFLGFLIVDC